MTGSQDQESHPGAARAEISTNSNDSDRISLESPEQPDHWFSIGPVAESQNRRVKNRNITKTGLGPLQPQRDDVI